MDTQLAAAATFVAHTRAWRARKAPRPAFRQLSAFKYSRDIFFDTPVGLVIPGRENYQPRSPRVWLDYFPRVSARDFRLGVLGGVIRDDKLQERAEMATFSPYGFTAVDLRGKGNAWVAERVPTVGEDRKQGLWAIRFRRVSDPSLAPRIGIVEATATLDRAVTAANAYAAGERVLGQWTSFFDASLAVLDGNKPATTDLLPERGYLPEARRLVAGARAAWVLGDIMSWTDYHPTSKDRQREHRRVTGDLYGALIEAVIAGVNEGLDA